MSLTRLPICLAFCASVLRPAHAASNEAATEQVEASLIASADAVHAGERIVLGVHQRIAAGWHTYGRDPGDSGLPTRIHWTLPDGAVVGEIQWPTTKRFQQGLITNFGYDGEVMLRADVSVPRSLRVGGSFPVRADVTWLVCREICIPQRVAL